MGVFWSGARAVGDSFYPRRLFSVRPLREGTRGTHYCPLFLDSKKKNRAPAAIASKHRIKREKISGCVVLAFPHLKPTATSWLVKAFERSPSHIFNRPPPPGQRKEKINTVVYKSDAPSPPSYCFATRSLGEARKAQTPVRRLMGGAFGARTSTAEFMPHLREKALEARFPSPNSDHDRGERRWKRAFTPSKQNTRLGGPRFKR